jgi:CHASE2 domain-containing sensor protein
VSAEAVNRDTGGFGPRDDGASKLEAPARLSPVDQVLAMPPRRALLDSRPAGRPVPKWIWLLPLMLALPGGIVGWLLVRNENQGAARALLVIGIVVTVFAVLSMGQTKALIGSLGL